MSHSDPVFPVPDQREVIEQARSTAEEELFKLQSIPGHRHCNGTKPDPRPCQTCQKETGDKFKVFRLLVTINSHD